MEGIRADTPAALRRLVLSCISYDREQRPLFPQVSILRISVSTKKKFRTMLYLRIMNKLSRNCRRTFFSSIMDAEKLAVDGANKSRVLKLVHSYLTVIKGQNDYNNFCYFYLFSANFLKTNF
jgi:hypothetical protein